DPEYGRFPQGLLLNALRIADHSRYRGWKHRDVAAGFNSRHSRGLNSSLVRLPWLHRNPDVPAVRTRVDCVRGLESPEYPSIIGERRKPVLIRIISKDAFLGDKSDRAAKLD